MCVYIYILVASYHSNRLYQRPWNISSLWFLNVEIHVFLFFVHQDDRESVPYFLPKCIQPHPWSYPGKLLVVVIDCLFVWCDFFLFRKKPSKYKKKKKLTPNKQLSQPWIPLRTTSDMVESTWVKNMGNNKKAWMSILENNKEEIFHGL